MTVTGQAGWYPDPSGAHQLRRWDGARWTEETADPQKQRIASSGTPEPANARALERDRKISSRRVRSEIGRVRWEQWHEKRGILKGANASRFWVQACGPNGIYTAAKSAQFDVSNNAAPSFSEGHAAFNSLMSDLWADGWEPTAFPSPGRLGGDRDWWDYRLRRVVQE